MCDPRLRKGGHFFMSKKNNFMLCAVTALFVTSCSPANDDFIYHYEPTFASIDTTNIEVNKLIVGMECNYSPFNWTDNSDNDYNLAIRNIGGSFADGYDVQIAALLGKALNMEVEIIKENWESLVPDVQTNTINLVLAGMTDTEERRESIDFSDEYYRSELVLITKKDTSALYNSVLTSEEVKTLLNNKSIISQVSTVTNDVIETFVSNYNAIHLSPLGTFAECAIDVSNGLAFAMTAEYPVAQAIVSSNPSLGIIRISQDILGVDLSELGVSIGIKKGNDNLKRCINEALSYISQDLRNLMMSEAVTRSGE